ncbi:hypothetical protein [Ferrovum sp.]|uniref:hypothetical protein n=1 Tax=Ferrovum sp. TaxID=2609467 RepID=UPI00260BB969|nr:hypothetical protein [Ferrovum sp.]
MLLQKPGIAERNQDDDTRHDDSQKNGIEALAIALENIVTLTGVGGRVLIVVHGQAASLSWNVGLGKRSRNCGPVRCAEAGIVNTIRSGWFFAQTRCFDIKNLLAEIVKPFSVYQHSRVLVFVRVTVRQRFPANYRHIFRTLLLLFSAFMI